jgi:TRAP-type C4-dicarboxylate transport system substrate-binding protein
MRFDGWPADVRSAVEAAVAEATPVQRQSAAEEDDICHDRLTSAGVEILPASAIDLAAFRRAAG